MSSYTFKKWQDGLYVDETDNVKSVPVTSTIPLVIDFTPSSDISEVKISTETKLLFEELVELFEVKEIESELFTIFVHLQETYITFEETFTDLSIPEFIDENKDYDNLFNILQEYLFNANNPLKSISFNFVRDTDKKVSLIKNEAVIEDVIKSVFKNLKITKDNFIHTKNRIQDESRLINYGKGGEYIRQKIVRELCQYIKTIKKNDSEYKILKFIGCFLHICQIPAYSTVDSIQIDSVEEEFDSIEVSIMRHYLVRPKKIFTK